MRHACSLIERNPIEIIHYANNHLFHEGIAGARRSIEELTPFANFHRICGTQVLPVFKQAILKHRMIRFATRKHPNVVSLASDNQLASLEDIARIDPYYLILGAVSKQAISKLLDGVLGLSHRPSPPFMYDPSNGLIDIDENGVRQVDPNHQRAMGRLIGLSIIHSVAICGRFSDNLLSAILGHAATAQSGFIQLGFHDILPNDSQFELQELITPTDLGTILNGHFKKIRLNQVQSATSTNLQQDHSASTAHATVIDWMWSFIKRQRDGPNAFVQLLTGSRCVPLGGVDMISPRLQVIVEQYIAEYPTPRVDTSMNTIYLPNYPSYDLLNLNLEQFMQM